MIRAYRRPAEGRVEYRVLLLRQKAQEVAARTPRSLLAVTSPVAFSSSQSQKTKSWVSLSPSCVRRVSFRVPRAALGRIRGDTTDTTRGRVRDTYRDATCVCKISQDADILLILQSFSLSLSTSTAMATNPLNRDCTRRVCAPPIERSQLAASTFNWDSPPLVLALVFALVPLTLLLSAGALHSPWPCPPPSHHTSVSGLFGKSEMRILMVGLDGGLIRSFLAYSRD